MYSSKLSLSSGGYHPCHGLSVRKLYHTNIRVSTIFDSVIFHFFQIKTHINSETKVLYHKNGKHILIIRIKIEGGKNMRNDDSYEAYKRKFNLGVVGVIILMLVLWFGNFDSSNHN